MKYTFEHFMQVETAIEPIKEEMQTSFTFSLVIDETTDVSIVKQMVIYGRYICGGEAKTRFLGVVELPDGTASTIYICTSSILWENGSEHTQAIIWSW